MEHRVKECRKKKADLKQKRDNKGKDKPKSDSANFTTKDLFATEDFSDYITSVRSCSR